MVRTDRAAPIFFRSVHPKNENTHSIVIRR
jgi:hypothetical protein